MSTIKPNLISITVLLSMVFVFLFADSLSCQTIRMKRLRAIDSLVKLYYIDQDSALTRDSINERYLSGEAYDRFFDRYFTQMQYQRQSFADGNSAALNVDDKATNLNLNLSHRSNNLIYNIGTIVNLSDGDGVIFSGNKPTVGTELSGGFSYLFLSSRNLTFESENMKLNHRKRRALIDSLRFAYSYRIPAEAERLEADSAKYAGRLTKFKSLSNSSNPAIAALYRDSVVEATDKLYQTIAELKKLDDGIETPAMTVEKIKKKADQVAIDKQLETEGVTKFHLIWTSAGVRYRKDNYPTYDSTIAFNKRIDDRDFDKWTFQGSLNYLWQKTDAYLRTAHHPFITSFYANTTLGLSRGNSYQDLKETNLSLIRMRTQSDSIYEFTKPYKIRDISGKSFHSFWAWSPSITLTPVFGKRQFLGLNVITSTRFQKGYAPVFNLRTGLLFRFKDNQKDASMVNFELFFLFQDMSDTRGRGKSVWQNKQIGVSANIPFQKVFFR